MQRGVALCLRFALDIASQGVVRGSFGTDPQPGVIAESLAKTAAGEAAGFRKEQAVAIARGLGLRLDNINNSLQQLLRIQTRWSQARHGVLAPDPQRRSITPPSTRRWPQPRPMPGTPTQRKVTVASMVSQPAWSCAHSLMVFPSACG